MEKSQSIAALAKALSLAQGEFPKIPCLCENPFFHSKYADLDAIISAVRPVLSKHGLAISQNTTIIPNLTDHACVSTMLMHESGEYITSDIAIKPTKADPQGMGSAFTYARRYALSAMLNLAADSDDDGNQASHQDNKKDEKKEVKAPFMATPQKAGPMNNFNMSPGKIEILKTSEGIKPDIPVKLANENVTDAENIPIAFLKARIQKAIKAGYDVDVGKFLNIYLGTIGKEIDDLDRLERIDLNKQFDVFSAGLKKKKDEKKEEGKDGK